MGACRSSSSRRGRLAVELHKDQVPHLEHVRVVHVDEVRRVSPSDPVIVQLAARPARADVAHLPKVVLCIARQHPLLREVAQPELARLLVRCQAEALVPLEVGCVEAVGREAVHLRQQLPRPVDRLVSRTLASSRVISRGPQPLIAVPIASSLK